LTLTVEQRLETILAHAQLVNKSLPPHPPPDPGSPPAGGREL